MNIKNNFLKSPIFYSYILMYYILLGAVSESWVSHLPFVIFTSAINTKIVYILLDYIKKQKQIYIKLVYIIILVIAILSFIFLTIYIYENMPKEIRRKIEFSLASMGKRIEIYG